MPRCEAVTEEQDSGAGGKEKPRYGHRMGGKDEKNEERELRESKS